MPTTAQSAAMTAADLGGFLDRLMAAESAGRDTARNPRSTALGPFQFIESTFLDIARRHFTAEVDQLTEAQILDLRVSRPFARRVAEIFTRENARIIAANDLQPTHGNLRLAHLLGPGAAVRLLQANPATPVAHLVGGAAVRANPFLSGMTAVRLARWAARDVGEAFVGPHEAALPAAPKAKAAARQDKLRTSRTRAPRMDVRCNAALASCRKWIALAKRRPPVQVAMQARRKSMHEIVR